MTCSECKHWKEWTEETGDYPIGDCYECSFAKAFGKSVRPHDATCKSFEKKVVET